MFLSLFIQIGLCLIQSPSKSVPSNIEISKSLANGVQKERIHPYSSSADDIGKTLNCINFYRRQSKLFELKLSALTSHQSQILAQSLFKHGPKQIPTFPVDLGNDMNLSLAIGKSICIKSPNAFDSIPKFFQKISTRHFLLNPKLYSIGIAVYDGIVIISETGMLEPGTFKPDYVAFPGPSVYSLNEISGFSWSFELIPDRLTNAAYASVQCQNREVKIRHQTVSKKTISFEIDEPLIPGQNYDVILHDIYQFHYTIKIEKSNTNSRLLVSEDNENLIQLTSGNFLEEGGETTPSGPDLESQYFCIGKRNRCMAISNLFVYYDSQIIDNNTLISILNESQKDNIQIYITQNTEITLSSDLYIMKHVSFISDPSVITEITITNPAKEYHDDKNATVFQQLCNIHQLSFQCTDDLEIQLLNISHSTFSNVSIGQRNITVDNISIDFDTFVSNHDTFLTTFSKITNLTIDGGNQLTNLIFRPNQLVNVSNQADYIDPGHVLKLGNLSLSETVFIISRRRLVLSASSNMRYPTDFRPIDIFIQTDYPAIEFDGTWIPSDPPLRFFIYEKRTLEFTGKTIPKNAPQEIYYFKKMGNDPFVKAHSGNTDLAKTVLVAIFSSIIIAIAFFTLFYLTYARKKKKYAKLENNAEEDESDYSYYDDNESSD